MNTENSASINEEVRNPAAGQAGSPEETTNVVKKKAKKGSALLAAAKWRSPVDHSLAHATGGLKGDYSNTGTNVSYEEEDV